MSPVTPTNPTSVQSWASYIDMAEVWPFLGMDNPPVGANLLRLQRFIDSACTVAQRGANRPFTPTQFQERHDGWSGEFIQLHYSPFLQLVSCVENMSTGGPINLPEAEAGAGVNGIQIDYGTSRIMRTFDGSWPRPFFPGSRNIWVTYVAGFNPVPADVWDATVDLIAYKWRMTQEAPRWFSAGGGAEYGGEATNLLFPGVPNRCAEVFEAYRIPVFG